MRSPMAARRRALLEGLLATEGVRSIMKDPPEPASAVLPRHLRKGEMGLAPFTTIAILGTPQEVTAQELRVKSFFPTGREGGRDPSLLGGGRKGKPPLASMMCPHCRRAPGSRGTMGAVVHFGTYAIPWTSLGTGREIAPVAWRARGACLERSWLAGSLRVPVPVRQEGPPGSTW